MVTHSIESWRDESWKLLHRAASFSDRVAVRFNELRKKLDKKIIHRAKRCDVRITKSDSKRGVWAFRVQSRDSPNSHLVNLRILPEKKIHDFMNEDFQTNCDCGHWQFWGPDFHSYQQGYLRGRRRSNGDPPNVRDPKRKKFVCKHVVAAFEYLVQNQMKRKKPPSGSKKPV